MFLLSPLSTGAMFEVAFPFIRYDPRMLEKVPMLAMKLPTSVTKMGKKGKYMKSVLNSVSDLHIKLKK